jgi:hypothetical protein
MTREVSYNGALNRLPGQATPTHAPDTMYAMARKRHHDGRSCQLGVRSLRQGWSHGQGRRFWPVLGPVVPLLPGSAAAATSGYRKLPCSCRQAFTCGLLGVLDLDAPGSRLMRHGVDVISLSSWEPQEEGMMSTAESFSLSNKPRFIVSRKKPNSRRWCLLAY